MSIEIVSAETAWANLRQNPNGRWPTRQHSERLYPLAAPETTANFQFDSQAKIFCIGSCFAREIERSLDQQDFQILSILRDLPLSNKRQLYDAGMANKYNVASIYQELEWAFYPEKYSDQIFIVAPGGLIHDYQLRGQSYADEFNSMQQFRHAFNRQFQLIIEADIVIITLGVSEIWFDKQTNLYLNVAPAETVVNFSPQRFELRIFDYTETLKYLEKIYQLLSANLTPQFRLLLTVSPVPLLATFRAQDVLLANSYSKSVLRTVVEEFMAHHSNKVSYFPSYETVNLTDPQLVWQDEDFRHVDHTMVNYITGMAMQKFVPEFNHSLKIDMTKAQILYRGKFFQQAFTLLQPHLNKNTYLDQPELLLLAQAIRWKFRYSFTKKIVNLFYYLHPKNWAMLRWFLGKKRSSQSDLSFTNTQSFIGYLEYWNGEQLTGWAIHRQQSSPLKLQILIGEQLIHEIMADLPRADVAAIYGQEYLHCGFSITLSEIKSYPVYINVCYQQQPLIHSPFLINSPTN
jgi:hypothetical protein